jgi:hypothetical protein
VVSRLDGQIIFIRHKFEDEPAKRFSENYLWNSEPKRIGVIFKEKGLDPSIYTEGGKAALQRLIECGRKGSVVAATYDDIEEARNKIVIGNVAKQELEEVPIPGLDRTLKAIPFEGKPRVITITSEWKILGAIQPQGTISSWNAAHKIVSAIVEGRKLDREVGSLLPSQTEVLCYEYMRKKRYLTSLLLPIGRTLRNVDVCGLDDEGQVVLAQVTYRNTAIDDKIRRLKIEKEPGARMYFFSRSTDRTEPGIEFISIEQVFKELDSDPLYNKVITKMIPDTSKL